MCLCIILVRLVIFFELIGFFLCGIVEEFFWFFVKNFFILCVLDFCNLCIFVVKCLIFVVISVIVEKYLVCRFWGRIWVEIFCGWIFNCLYIYFLINGGIFVNVFIVFEIFFVFIFFVVCLNCLMFCFIFEYYVVSFNLKVVGLVWILCVWFIIIVYLCFFVFLLMIFVKCFRFFCNILFVCLMR